MTGSESGSFGIRPLDAEQREAYPHEIFRLELGSPRDALLAGASFEVMETAGYPVAIDLEADGENAAILRSRSEVKKDRGVESALFEGLIGATRVKVDADDSMDDDVYYEKARDAAGGMLNDLVSDPFVYDLFKRAYGYRFYSGFDAFEFEKGLLVAGTDFDPEILKGKLKIKHLRDIVEDHGAVLGVEIGQDEPNYWYEKDIPEMLKKHPQMDYRRLRDEAFRDTPEGRLLESVYARVCGQILAEEFRENIIKKERDHVIPLTRFPIIEAVVAGDFSPAFSEKDMGITRGEREVLVLRSDSEIAHQALVQLSGARPIGDFVSSILRFYDREKWFDDKRAGLVKSDLLFLLEAYNPGGDLARSVREKYQSAQVRDKLTLGDESTVSDFKDVTISILSTAVVAPDPEVAAKAEQILERVIQNVGTLDAESDPASFSRADVIRVAVDSLNLLSRRINPGVIERIGEKLFGDADLFEKFKSLVDIQVKRGVDGGRRERDIVLRRAKGVFLMDLIESIRAEDPATFGKRVDSNAFADLIKNIDLGGDRYQTSGITNECRRLIDFAKSSGLDADYIGSIVKLVCDRFEYFDGDAAELVPVILDLFNITLGDAENLRKPEWYTSYRVEDIAKLLSNNQKIIFESVSPEDLTSLSKYAVEARLLHDSLLAGEIPVGWDVSVVDNDKELEDLKRYQEDIVEHLEVVNRLYNRHLEMVGVRSNPEAYMLWLHGRAGSFWRRLQVDFETDQSRGGAFSRLHRIVGDFERNRIYDGDSLPEGFDPLADGNLNGIIRNIYETIYVFSDEGLRYSRSNPEGQYFLSEAVKNMPESVFQQLLEQNKADLSFSTYLERTRQE